MNAGFDLAYSEDAVLGHTFAVPFEFVIGGRAIPVVPLYISLLYRIMREKNLHEGTIEQMVRLWKDHLAPDATPTLDAEGRIRVDDWVFGVSSVSADGYESPVASAVPGGAFKPYVAPPPKP